ncbi:MAG: flagellar biosynthesis protein FlhB, partial [Pirellula sp.]
TTRLGFGLVKISLVAGILIGGVWGRWDAILALGTAELSVVGKFVWTTMIELCRNVAIALVVLSVVDYAFQRWKYEQDLRMTDEDLREEMKMTQGDPHTKSRRRKVQRELAQQRLSVDVPKADVVVTNPTELAIALQYDPQTMKAPIVLAKGADLVAAKIRKIALENGIPIVERKPLAQALFKQVDVGKPIPLSEYAAVAEVLKYVYQVKGKSVNELTETLQKQTRKAG